VFQSVEQAHNDLIHQIRTAKRLEDVLRKESIYRHFKKILLVDALQKL